MRKRLIVLLLIALTWNASLVWAESAYSLSEQGIELYQQGKYKQALEKFIAAQIEDPEDKQVSYNLGNAYYKIKDYEKAAKNYLQSVLENKDARLAEKSYYNLGNAFFRQNKLQEAVAYYKKALELDPKDMDSKKNLEFVQKLLKQQQEQQQQQQQNQEEKSEGDKEKTPGEQDKGEKQQAGGEQEDKEQQQAQNQEKDKGKEKEKGKVEAAEKQEEQKEGKEQKAAQALKQMSEEEAQRWLNSLTEDRQKFMRRQMLRKQAKGRKVEKDW